MKKNDVLNKLIYPSLKEVLVDSDKFIEESYKNTETFTLIGSSSLLDSMDLVTLIINIEEKIFNLMNLSITLANEKAMSRKNSPFKTVETLAEYITEILENNK
jgi:acyl carrier protein